MKWLRHFWSTWDQDTRVKFYTSLTPAECRARLIGSMGGPMEHTGPRPIFGRVGRKITLSRSAPLTNPLRTQLACEFVQRPDATAVTGELGASSGAKALHAAYFVFIASAGLIGTLLAAGQGQPGWFHYLLFSAGLIAFGVMYVSWCRANSDDDADFLVSYVRYLLEGRNTP